MGRKSEQGAVMIEAVWCVLLVMFVFLTVMSLGFLLYQRVMVQIVANEVAEEVAQTYKLKGVMDSGSVTPNAVSKISAFRYLPGFAGTHERAAETKLKTIAPARLSQTSFALEEGSLKVDVEQIADDLGRYHLKVTVSQKYGFLLGDFLQFIGQKERCELESVVYVNVSDISFQANFLRSINGLLDVLTDGGIGKLIETIIGATDDLGSLFGC